MARIVANVVDMQQHLVSQYQTVVNSMDGVKSEMQSQTQVFREELRRIEDRSQKQVDDLRCAHNNEVARLMEMIKILLLRDVNASAAQAQLAANEPPRMTPAQVAYANAAPASSFFGMTGGTVNDIAAQAQAHYAACYLQQLQEQQRIRAAGAQGGGFFGSQPSVAMGGFAAPATGAFPQSQSSAPVLPTAVPSAPKPPVAAIGSAPPPAVPQSNTSFAAAPVVTAPSSVTAPTLATSAAPATGLFGKPLTTVSLPISSTQQPPKTEIATPKSDTAAQKPVLSFITSKPTTSPAVSEPPKPTSIFAGIKPTENVFSKTPESKSILKKESGDAPDDDDHDHVEEFEPQVDFKPVCPLPELVKVVTGEEDEKVIFEERCKLYRYSDESKEWKERGTGVMKVLENASTKKCRIVMRREQVYKVCANHQLLPGMTVQPMSRQEKAMVWYCEDFSEEEGTHEKLSARFSSSEVANKFKEVFENAVKSAEKASPLKPAQDDKKELDKASNDDVKDKKTGDDKDEKAAAAAPKAYGEQFKLQPGQWECPECYSRTDAEKCPCCGACKGGTKAPEPVARSVLPASSIPLGGAPAGGQKFTFGLSAAAAAKDSPAASSSNTPKSSLFGASLVGSATTPSGGLTFGTKPSIFGGAVSKPSGEGTPSLPAFSFAKKPDSASTPTSTTTTTASTPVTFSFKQAGSTTPGAGGSVFGSKLFGGSGTTPSEKKEEPKKEGTDSGAQQKGDQKVFGSGFSGSLSFASVAKASSGSIFDPVNIQKAKAEFDAQAKSKPFTEPKDKSAASDAKGKGDSGDGEGEGGADEEYEPDVHFAPVIPLPDLVDVVTGEEEEQVMFTARAKLFRFIKETKENKERGVGDLKILRNPKTNAYRVVMRREQVHKVCANFAILPTIELNEKKGMPNVYNWICRDYSESPDGIDEIFTAKFKSAEIAKEFHDKFKEAAAAHPSAAK